MTMVAVLTVVTGVGDVRATGDAGRSRKVIERWCALCARMTPGSLASSRVLMAVALQFAAGSYALAHDPHLGIIEYEISCLPCHGLDGRGDGFRAKSLKTAPADLTKISKSNNGVFPSQKVAEIIDGRAIVGTHGQRDMPVWGDRYRVRAVANEPTSEINRRALAQIAALVEYLRTIQEK